MPVWPLRGVTLATDNGSVEYAGGIYTLVEPAEHTIGCHEFVHMLFIVLAPYCLRELAYVAPLAVFGYRGLYQRREIFCESLFIHRGKKPGRTGQKLPRCIGAPEFHYKVVKLPAAFVDMIDYILIQFHGATLVGALKGSSLIAHTQCLIQSSATNLVKNFLVRPILLNFVVFLTDVSMSNPQSSQGIIVVLGRQFGSGGRKIGLRIAREFGLSYYDKEMLSEAAQRRGFSQAIFANNDEKRPSLLRSMLSDTFGTGSPYTHNLLCCESIYQAQSSVIKELAEEGGCVFVGRSADYILRHHPRLVSIFLHAPVEHRACNLMQRGEVDSIEKGGEMARRLDRKREEFYNYFTGRHWGRADNYHLSLDTSLLSDDAIVEIIKTYIRERTV